MGYTWNVEEVDHVVNLFNTKNEFPKIKLSVVYICLYYLSYYVVELGNIQTLNNF